MQGAPFLAALLKRNYSGPAMRNTGRNHIDVYKPKIQLESGQRGGRTARPPVRRPHRKTWLPHRKTWLR
jgi:hypothetical protein